jgi:hypothetical protein
MRSLATLLVATMGVAKQTATDIPVTSYLADYSASNMPYYVQSDGLGAYSNGVNNTFSILVANAYNHLTDGDWRLDLSSSTVRTIRVTFAQANAVQPGDPGYTAPANPPYWGTGFEAVRMENKCTFDNHDMLTMKVGDKFTCPLLIHFPPLTSAGFYRLEMGWTELNEPETQEVQIACNSTNSGGCNDWFIDPIPVVNPDGSTSPGETRARLDLVNMRGTGTLTNEGDFYLTFHFHVTRP